MKIETKLEKTLADLLQDLLDAVAEVNLSGNSSDICKKLGQAQLKSVAALYELGHQK